MLRPLAMVAGAGLIGVVALKLLGILFLPLLGMLLGFLVWAVKITVIISLIWWGFHLFRKWTERGNEA